MRSHKASTFVFLGPTLEAAAASDILDAVYLPPVKCGDLLHLWRISPRLILIIDGVFREKAAVWHKEILFCMSRDITVAGASSMGALRAAELSMEGMIGLGHVTELFKTNVLEDDDEVALLHTGSEWGYRRLSVPMVDVRSSLDLAVQLETLTSHQADEIASNLKNVHFSIRDEICVRESMRRVGGCGNDAQIELCSIKRADAIQALSWAKRYLEDVCTERVELPVTPPFNWTTFFNRLWVDIHTSPFPDGWEGQWVPDSERWVIDASKQEGRWKAIRLHAKLSFLVMSIGHDHCDARSSAIPTSSALLFENARIRARSKWQDRWASDRVLYLNTIDGFVSVVQTRLRSVSDELLETYCEDINLLLPHFLSSSPGAKKEAVRQLAALWAIVDRCAEERVRVSLERVDELISPVLDESRKRIEHGADDNEGVRQAVRAAAPAARLADVLSTDTRVLLGAESVVLPVNWASISLQLLPDWQDLDVSESGHSD